MAVKKIYDLDAEQTQKLDRAFHASTPRDGWAEKFEAINEAFVQASRKLFKLSPKSEEQDLALRKMQEAQFYFELAIKRHEL